MSINIHPSWKEKLAEEFEKEYFKNLTNFVREEYSKKTIYPPPKNIFRAFDLCPFDSVRVVILGQDPYHGASQANGLCFSVYKEIGLPPSLKNIYKEIEDDLGIKMPAHGDLENWAKQGVLLLNATLTVQASQAGSHQGKGWEEFTDAAIKKLADEKENIVFLLWGKYAQEKGKFIDEFDHLVLRAPHPSPFSAHSGFFGSKHFSQTNEFLEGMGKNKIDWGAI